MVTETVEEKSKIAVPPDEPAKGLRPVELEAGLALALLGLALLLRLANLNANSLSLDEAMKLRVSNETSLRELLFYHRTWFLQPPLYFVTLHLWAKLFGAGELAARLFPVVMSVANLGLVYLLVRPRLGQRVALTGLLLLALSPLDLYWSQSVRPPTWFGLLVTASLALALYSSENPRHNWRWLLYGLSALAVIYASYLGLHVLLGEAVFLVITLYKNPKALLRAGITLGLVALAFAPYLGNALEQFNSAGPYYTFYSGPVQMVEAFQYLAMYIHQDWLLTLAGACFVPLWLLGLDWLWRTRRALAWWLLCGSVVPLVTSWFGSLFRSNFIPQEYNFCLPAFLIMVAVGLWRLFDLVRPVWAYLMLLAALALNLTASLDYYQNFRTPDFRGAATYIAQNRQEGDLLFLANGYGYTSWVVDYYLHAQGQAGGIDHGILPDTPTRAQFDDLIKNRKRVWVLVNNDGSKWAEKYAYPWLSTNYKAVYNREYYSTDQGNFTLTLYTNP